MGKKKCCCGLDWCQALDNRELDRGGEGYPFGCMRLPRDRPEDLARWLTSQAFTWHNWQPDGPAEGYD